jgi:hypothetical protein
VSTEKLCRTETIVHGQDYSSATPTQAFTKLAFSRREAATMLGISPASLDRLVVRGLLKPSRALRKPLFAISELERFLRETTASIE